MRTTCIFLGWLALLALTPGCEGPDDPVAPQISELVVQPVTCGLELELDWRDHNGDLEGARYHVECNAVSMSGWSEGDDAINARLRLFVPVADDLTLISGGLGGLLPGESCDVVVWLEDAAGHNSNTLTAAGIVVPEHHGCVNGMEVWP